MAELIRPDFNLKESIGTVSILLNNIEELQLFQSYINQYIRSEGPNDVTIISVLPIPSKYSGAISGKVNIDYTTKKVQTGTTYDDHTTGNFEVNGELPMNLNLSGIQFLLTYDVSARS